MLVAFLSTPNFDGVSLQQLFLMKYRVSLNRRNLIVEANSKDEAAREAEKSLKRGERIYSIKKVDSSVSNTGSWWEIWLD